MASESPPPGRVPLHVVTTVMDNAAETRQQLESVTTESARWQESWEQLVRDIGDLLQRVRARPKGRRFATVLELTVLLTSQCKERDDD